MKNNNVNILRSQIGTLECQKNPRNMAKYNDVRILRSQFGTLELKNKGGKNE